ncbi:MAG: hypothetical protein ACTSVZ_07810 [Promethearchaeota archaeon]
MKELIFKMMYELLDLSIFELEYTHRLKNNLFSEKWKNSSLTRSRSKNMKQYLYNSILIFLRSDKQKDFFETVLRPFVHCNYSEFVESFKNQQKFGDRSEIPLENMNILYTSIFYKLTFEELFILLTNVIMWEHQSYPFLLEDAICQEHQNQTDIDTSDDLLRYYIRFLDVLSSTEIISLFDLDALRNTIKLDYEKIGQKSLSSLLLFRDWPTLNTQSFHGRFPEFKQNLSQKIVHGSEMLVPTAFDLSMN